MFGILQKLVFFTKLRKLGKANALGLICGAGAWLGLSQIEDTEFAASISDTSAQAICAALDFCNGLSPVTTVEIIASIGAVITMIVVTKLYNVLAPRIPFLQKAEKEAEELLDMVPEIEAPTTEQKHLSTGPENGNYNKE
jgi:hypothetical protein